MRFVPRFQTLIVLAASVILVPAASREAHAVAVTDCETTCTSNCDLALDLDCPSFGVILSNGADFDFQGHTIGCSFAGACGGSAIAITGNNSIVKDSGTVKGGIRAGYVIGVDCGSKAGSQVTGITVSGVEGTAIKDCSIVEQNTLVSGGEDDEYITYAVERNAGISATADRISDNYISWFGRGIKAAGTKPIAIERNVVVVGPGLSPHAGIVTISATSGYRVRSNTILSEEDTFPPLSVNAATAASANYCDGTKSGCATCIAAGKCEPFEHAICGVTTFRAKIVANGSLNQADTVIPVGVPVAYRFFLVDDYPDVGLEPSYGVSGRTLFQYTGTGIGIGTDLFKIELSTAPEGMVFESCTLRAHMIAEGTPAGFSPTWLVVRHGGLQSDGSQINVLPTFIGEYARVMTSNPITNQPWTSDELASTYQIGVKNNVGSGSGVGVTDLVLECQ